MFSNWSRLCFVAIALLTTVTGIDCAGTFARAKQSQKATPEVTGRRWALPTADVLIDAGHGGIDGGTHYDDFVEKDITLAIARKLYLLLRSRGVTAVLNRTGDYALSDDNRTKALKSRHRKDLTQRSGLSNELGADLFVSIHVNWAVRRNKSGPLVLHRPEGRSSLLASFLQDSLNRQLKKQRLPRDAVQYHVLSRVLSPSVIVETGFLSDPGDREMLTSRRGQTVIAEAIASGIKAYRAFAP